MKNIQTVEVGAGNGRTFTHRYVKCHSHAYGDTCEIETDFTGYTDGPVFCDVCGEIKPVVALDTSGGEYATIRICGDCFGQLLAEFKQEFPK